MSEGLVNQHVELSIDTTAHWLVRTLYEQLVEEHLKPSWLQRQKEIERHQAEKARLLEYIEALHESARIKEAAVLGKQPLDTHATPWSSAEDRPSPEAYIRATK